MRFHEAITMISSINIFKTVPIPLYHLSLQAPPFPENHWFAYCASKFGFPGILCEWIIPCIQFWGMQGLVSFFQWEKICPGYVLYNSYGRNEIGSYLTCHCLKYNTNFYMFLQSTESKLQKSSKIDYFWSDLITHCSTRMGHLEKTWVNSLWVDFPIPLT